MIDDGATPMNLIEGRDIEDVKKTEEGGQVSHHILPTWVGRYGDLGGLASLGALVQRLGLAASYYNRSTRVSWA